MTTCENCRFWEGGGEAYNEAISAHRCTYAIHTEDATEWNDEYDRVLKNEYKETKAFTVDGLGHYAALYTMPDFGCNQHKEKL